MTFKLAKKSNPYGKALTRSLPLALAGMLAWPALTASADDHKAHKHEEKEMRHADAHAHGVSKLNIVVEGKVLVLELESPGNDLVGFEHEAKSAADKKAVKAVEKTLADPLALFAIPQAAKCKLDSKNVEYEVGDDDHDDHDDHDKKKHKSSAKKSDDHDHDHEKEDKHDHADSELEAGHAEFHASYVLNCEKVAELKTISFPFFDKFKNAKELRVAYISGNKQKAFTATAKNKSLTLK